jgi:hypothetical protein
LAEPAATDAAPRVRPGRLANRSYPLNQTHDLQLLSKTLLPRFSSALPRHPGPCPDDPNLDHVKDAEWWERANKWARIVISLFLPWQQVEATLGDADPAIGAWNRLRPQAFSDPEPYNWLQRWAWSLAPDGIASVDPWALDPIEYANLGRLATIRNLVWMTSVPAAHRSALNKYRRRNADEISVALGGVVTQNADVDEHRRHIAELLRENELVDRLTLADASPLKAAAMKFAQALDDATPPVAELLAEQADAAQLARADMIFLDQEQLAECKARIQGARTHADAVGDGAGPPPLPPRDPLNDPVLPGDGGMPGVARVVTDEELRAVAAAQNLTPGQRTFVHAVIEQLVRNKPGLLVLHGPPGSGKTYTMNALRPIVERAHPGGEVLCTAYTGIAASVLKSGRQNEAGLTVHSAFAISISGESKKAAFLKEAEARMRTARIVVIDEMSMLTAAMLHRVERQLRMLAGCDEPFGGRILVLSGDFDQLPPVRGTCLAAQATRGKDVSASAIAGKQLFDGAVHVELMRRDPTCSRFDERQGRKIDRILACPASARDELASYKQLTRADRGDWLWAPIVTLTNMQRLEYVRKRLPIFGHMHNRAALVWVENSPNALRIVNRIGRENVWLQHPLLCNAFVEGAPCMLLANLATRLGLANGTRGTLVGVQWSNVDLNTQYRTLLQTAASGSVNVIDHAPTHVIVRVNDLLVPIEQTHNDEYKVGRACVVFKKFPYDVLFAATYYKVQALSLQKVIVDVSSPAHTNVVKFPELYVALSRATTVDGVRVFLLGSMAKNNMFRASKIETWLDTMAKQKVAAPPGPKQPGKLQARQPAQQPAHLPAKAPTWRPVKRPVKGPAQQPSDHQTAIVLAKRPAKLPAKHLGKFAPQPAAIADAFSVPRAGPPPTREL